MARLFLALWPDAPARGALGTAARALAERCDGRAVPARNLHLTLAFLGEIDPGREGAILAAAEAVVVPAFRLVLDRLGSFPRTGVAWAGCAAAPPELSSLQAQLDGRLRDAGFALERRPFSPHVTLARRIAKPVAPGPWGPVSWHATRFSLVESAREAGGYRERAAWNLEA